MKTPVWLALVLAVGTSCAAAVPTTIRPLPSLALPVLPEGARQILTRPLACSQGFGVLKGYDTNGSGDYDLLELWRDDKRIVVIQYDAATKQEVVAVFVQEGARVAQYTWEAVQIHYPTLCSLLAVPEAA